MATRRFAVTWDYRCPFARNAHEHVLTGLEAGADWDVTFVPFSLGQVHVADGEPDVWDRPDTDTGLLALQVGTVVRDRDPERFLAVHRALFALRHDQGGALTDRAVLAKVLTDAGVDDEVVFAAADDGTALAAVREAHTAAARDSAVWGVPTFLAHGSAAFVRFMHRPGDDAEGAITTIERTIDLLAWSDLNEFKHTSISR